MSPLSEMSLIVQLSVGNYNFLRLAPTSLTVYTAVGGEVIEPWTVSQLTTKDRFPTH